MNDTGPSIFIIEDERAFVQAYNEIFKFAEFQLADWAFSGEEALEKYQTRIKDPDLIIMDHRLPGINGVETMQQIIRMDPSAKILFVSADDKARRLSLENGAVGFLLKPFSLLEFIRIVEENVSNKAEHRQSF